MKPLRRLYALLLLPLAVFVCGCEQAYRSWPQVREMVEEAFYPPPPPRPAPPPPSETFVSPAPVRHTSVARHRHTRKHHATAVAKTTPPAEVETPVVKPEPVSAPAPVITMEDDSATVDKMRAESMLMQTRTRYAAIDRDALDASDGAIYDQAGRFLRAASQALRDDNYSVASGFAAKALLLTNRLADTRQSH
jgi:hypothetical protein